MIKYIYRMFKKENINESLSEKLEKHWLLEKFSTDDVDIFGQSTNKLFSDHYNIFKKVK